MADDEPIKGNPFRGAAPAKGNPFRDESAPDDDDDEGRRLLARAQEISAEQGPPLDMTVPEGGAANAQVASAHRLGGKEMLRQRDARESQAARDLQERHRRGVMTGNPFSPDVTGQGLVPAGQPLSQLKLRPTINDPRSRVDQQRANAADVADVVADAEARIYSADDIDTMSPGDLAMKAKALVARGVGGERTSFLADGVVKLVGQGVEAGDRRFSTRMILLREQLREDLKRENESFENNKAQLAFERYGQALTLGLLSPDVMQTLYDIVPGADPARGPTHRRQLDRARLEDGALGGVAEGLSHLGSLSLPAVRGGNLMSEILQGRRALVAGGGPVAGLRMAKGAADKIGAATMWGLMSGVRTPIPEGSSIFSPEDMSSRLRSATDAAAFVTFFPQFQAKFSAWLGKTPALLRVPLAEGAALMTTQFGTSTAHGEEFSWEQFREHGLPMALIFATMRLRGARRSGVPRRTSSDKEILDDLVRAVQGTETPAGPPVETSTGLTAQRGMTSLDLAGAPGKLANAVGRFIRGKGGFGSIIGRVADHKGATTQRGAALATQAVVAQRVAVGKIADIFDAALEATGASSTFRHPILSMKQALAAGSLGKPRLWPGAKTAYRSDFHDIGNGKMEAQSAAAIDMMNKVEALSRATGGLFEEAGIMQSQRDGSLVPFRTAEGRILPRFSAPEFMGILAEGPKHRLWRGAVDAFVEVGNKRESVEAHFRELAEAFNAEGPDAASRQFNAEMSRVIENHPVGFMHSSGGINTYVPILVTHPNQYVQALGLRSTSRVGFLKAFSQEFTAEELTAPHREAAGKARSQLDADELAGTLAAAEKNAPRQDRRPSKMIEAARSEGGKRAAEDLRQMFRVLHGLPLDDPFIAAGTPGISAAQRFAGKSTNLVAEAILSGGTQIPNALEPFGPTRTFIGTKNLARALGQTTKLGRLARAPLEKMGILSKSMVTMKSARDVGLVSQDIIDMTPEAIRPGSSGLRILTNAIGKVMQRRRAEQFGEDVIGVGALMKVEDMMARAGPNGTGAKATIPVLRDAQKLIALGYGRAKARRLARGIGTPEEYHAVAVTAAQKIQGGIMGKGQQSYWENKRAVSAFTRFRMFTLMRLREAGNQSAAFSRGMGEMLGGTKGDVSRWKVGVASAQQYADFMAGVTLAPIAGTFVAAWVLGGAEKVAVEAARAIDDWKGFVAKGLISGTLSGPLGTAYRSLTGRDDIEDALFHVAIYKEVSDYASSSGAYKNLDGTDRLDRLMRRVAPVKHFAENIITTLGLAGENAREERSALGARTAYWNWRFSRRASVDEPSFDESEVKGRMKQWGILTRKARESIIKKEHPRVANQFLWDAIGITEGMSRSNAISKLRSQKLLDLSGLERDGFKLTDEQKAEVLDEIRSHMGDQAFDRLVAQDKLFDRQIAIFKRATTKSGERAQ